jgi:putative two-component system response regulator
MVSSVPHVFRWHVGPFHSLAEKWGTTIQLEIIQWRLRPLRRIANAADAESPGHIDRVSRYSAVTAAELGQPEKYIDLIRIASLFHDVGKHFIPRHILKKNGPLTPEERQVVQRHAALGTEMIQKYAKGVAIPDDLFDLMTAITEGHHEWFNGAGYPRGARGTAIPLGARILAVSDVYDALTSNRPYKKAWTSEQALAEMEKGRGTQFDPHVLDAFKRALSVGTGRNSRPPRSILQAA